MFSKKTTDIQCLWNLSISECWIRTDWNERMGECRNDNVKMAKINFGHIRCCDSTVRFWVLHGSEISSFDFFHLQMVLHSIIAIGGNKSEKAKHF